MGQVIPEGEVPEEVRTVNEFLNTIDLETFGENSAKRDEERDKLRNVQLFKEWLVARGLIGAGEVVTEADRALAVRLRTVLRESARANVSADVSGHTEDQAVDKEDHVLSELPLVIRLGANRSPQVTSDLEGAKGALGRLLAGVAIATATGTWARLKICKADDCQWAYYDHSRSRTGRWCAMETCGNRHKTRNYRARHKTK
jgi:predicted RNA-binding Zn ribbon-like protein